MLFTSSLHELLGIGRFTELYNLLSDEHDLFKLCFRADIELRIKPLSIVDNTMKLIRSRIDDSTNKNEKNISLLYDILTFAKWESTNEFSKLESIDFHDIIRRLEKYTKLWIHSKDGIYWKNRTFIIWFHIFVKTRKFEEATQIYNNLHIDFYDELSVFSQIEWIIRKGELLGEQRIFDQAYTEFGKAEKLVTENSIDYLKITINRQLGLVYAKQDDFDNATKYFEAGLKSTKGEENPEDTGNVLSNLGIIAYMQSRLQEALDYYNRGLEYFNQMQKNGRIVTVIVNKAGLLNVMARINDALQTLLEGKDFILKYGDREAKFHLYRDIAYYYIRQGDFDNAELYHKLMNKQAREDKIPSAIVALSYSQQAELFLLQGKFAEAEEILQSALSIWNQPKTTHNKPGSVAAAKRLFGVVKFVRGEPLEAVKFLTESLEYFSNTNLTGLKCKIYFALVEVLLSINRDQEAYEYVLKLNELTAGSENLFLMNRAKIAESLYQLRDDRSYSKEIAMILLEETLSSDLIDNESTTFSKLLMVPLLLREYGLTGELETLRKIQALIEELATFALDQNSDLLITKIMYLQACLYRINAEVSQARIALKQALLIADANGYEVEKKIIEQLMKELEEESLLAVRKHPMDELVHIQRYMIEVSDQAKKMM